MITFLQNTKKSKLIIAIAIVWLYILPIITNYLLPNYDNPRKVIALIEKDILYKQKQFEDIKQNATLISTLINKEFDESIIKKTAAIPFAFQLYQIFNDSIFSLKYWNKNDVIPTANELKLPDGQHIIQKQNELAQLNKYSYNTDKGKIILTAIIPLYWDYFIETDYLKKEFAASSKISKQYELSTQPTIYPVKNSKGKTIFYLNKKQNVRNHGSNWFFIICRLLCCIGILYSIINYTHQLLKNKTKKKSLLFYSISSVVFWHLLCNSNLFFNRIALEIFDPSLYAVGFALPSLVHLIVAVIFCFIGLVFVVQQKPKFQFSNKIIAGFSVNFLLTTLLYQCVSFFIYWLIKTIISFSTISFNVTNFFSLDKFTIIGFLLAAAIIFIYYYVTQKILSLHTLSLQNNWLNLFFLSSSGLVLLSVIYFLDADVNYLFILIWTIIYFFVSKKIRIASYNTLHLSAVWTIIFGFGLALIFLSENDKKELVDRKYFAKKLAFQSDPNTENLIGIALSKFNNEYLKKGLIEISETNNIFRSNVINENFVGYLNKFQTNVYVYDSTEKPLYNEYPESLSYFTAMLQNQAVKVPSLDDLYFIEVGFDQFSYIFKKNIYNNNNETIGYFVVQANPITYRNKSTALSPELFKQRNNKLDDKGNNYIYAIYNNLTLRRKYFDYDLPTKLTKRQMPMQEDTLQIRNGHEELWYKLNNNTLVIVGKKKQTLLAVVTLFAYLFLAMLIINSIISIVQSITHNKLQKNLLQTLLQWNFSKQVQFIVWLVSLFTFIVISYVIIVQFQNRYYKNNKERLNRTMQILLTDVQNKLNTQNVFDDVVKVYEPIVNKDLKDMVMRMSEIHNVDFNIYDLQGDLKISSQPFLETKGIVSNKINSLAYYNLWSNKSAQYLQKENIGSFTYLSMYVPIRDDKGNPYGYLNIPYYSSVSDLNQEISNFLIIIINITAFVFLIAGLIAWLVTNRITHSFELISSKMKAVELGKNEPIEWNRNDEIGGLVNEYNKMVAKLEQSAQQLAKNEREGAWREMARQIAHEIKNPLTPMKLSIQYLQKSIASGHGNIEQLTEKVSTTLVDQIEHLNNIASDFSNFANIANTKAEMVDVAHLLQQIADLMQHETNAKITTDIPQQPINIQADKTQINRLFTNIIKNALQAYDDNETKLVHVSITTNNNKAEIVIADKANGIPPELQSKIFTPNFTTKSSGTGLGLAICKGIVENANGTIRFETKENIGTSFIIEFPLGAV